MRVSVVCSTVAMMSLGAAVARADSASCHTELVAALKKTWETPNHTYLSQIGSGAQGLVVKSEMINAGNKTYVKLDDMHMGKTKLGDDSWSVARSTPQETAKLVLDSMRDAAKEVKNFSCAHVRDETVDGIAAAVYAEHAETEDGNSDSQIWIAKSQGWIVKYEVKIDDMTTTTRYVYTDIQAPANVKAAGQ